jgi:DNA-directed RNA polymerase subunit N (RpoN/RPB10)
MIIPIRCFTCGKVIADKWRYYQEECKKIEDAAESKGSTSTTDAADANPKGAIMDRMELSRMCCRRHILTHVELTDYA